MEIHTSEIFIGCLKRNIIYEHKFIKKRGLPLNVALDGCGKIPDAQANVLHQPGAWLQASGVAIYDVERNPFPHTEHPITAKAGKLYIHLKNSASRDTVELDDWLTLVAQAYILSDNTRRPGNHGTINLIL